MQNLYDCLTRPTHSRTCRLIEGEIKVEDVELYIPKKGDIVIVDFCYTTSTFIVVWGDIIENTVTFQSSFLLSKNSSETNKPQKGGFYIVSNKPSIHFRKASEIEANVMYKLLSDNNLMIVEGEVKEKSWRPKIGELFFYPTSTGGKFFTNEAIIHDITKLELKYFKNCFKTVEECDNCVMLLNVFMKQYHQGLNLF